MAFCLIFLWADLSLAQHAPYVSDLINPIGLEVDDQGWLWVAEVGTGNNDGRISIVTPEGQVQPVLEGLGSIAEAGGVAGSYHLEFIGDALYVTNGLGTETAEGYLLRVDVSGFTPATGPLTSAAIDTVANTGAFAGANGLMENNLYDVEPGPDGDLFLADAGANAVFRMDGETGEMRVLMTLDPVQNPTPIGPPVIEGVPSKLLYHNETLYVSMFSGFPFAEGVARIYAVTMDGEVSIHSDGLTMITDMMIDPSDGSLLVLQMGLYDPAAGFIPETGSLVRVREDGLDSLFTGLLLPTGMHAAPDGDVFISSLAGLIFKLPANIATSVEDTFEGIPTQTILDQNYPNPFNPTTTIRFHLQQATNVQLTVYDVQGREITRLVNGIKGSGTHEISWDARAHASGMYFYSLQTEGHVETRTMLLTK